MPLTVMWWCIRAFSPHARGEGAAKRRMRGPSPGASRHPLPQAGEGTEERALRATLSRKRERALPFSAGESLEKLSHRLVELLRLLHVRQMPGVLDDQELRVRQRA